MMTAAKPIRRSAPNGDPPFLFAVRLRAHRRALWLRSLWSADESDGPLAITHSEVDRLLADTEVLAAREAAFYANDPRTVELTTAIEAADETPHARWDSLCRTFDLSHAERNLLALCVAVGADPAFGRVCGYLQDSAAACFPTVRLAESLFSSRHSTHAGVYSSLLRWQLAQTSGAIGRHAQWTADPYVVEWLLGTDSLDPALAGSIWMDAADISSLECLDPAIAVEILDFISAIRQTHGGSQPIEIELAGPEGAGKRTLAAQVCADLGYPLLVVASVTQSEQLLLAAARTAKLEGAVLYWNHADNFDARARQAIEGLCPLVFYGVEAPGKQAPKRAARRAFAMRPLRQWQRLQLWNRFTSEPLPKEMADWALRPGELRAAAQVACAGSAAVLETCRHMLRQEPGELFTALPLCYGWDDVVLTPAVRQQLEELAAQASLRSSVLDHWGFGSLSPMGRGISALFAGPSGTGKTMAAQVVAGSLGRELCRVDLAEVVNKYIGETEKRLKRVFDACERSAVVLFFDEADALFGQRTQVKDSHDRYANIQVDYLLQRMEQFDGVAILATNRKNDLDSAFMRRLRFVIEFPLPGPAERMILWRKSLRETSPSGEVLLAGVDWHWMAQHLSLTGAGIKATALAAAFLAKAEGSRIRMDHILHAARREMAKLGAPWRAGEWRPEPHA